MRSLVCAVLVPLLLPIGASGAHAAGTCQGHPATIESGGGEVTGTEGDDVILVTGPANVNALGGDDVICLNGGTLTAGTGNDRVEVTGSTAQLADLGPGDDYYSSTGSARDTVDASSAGGSSDSDTIRTGEGGDSVGSGVLGEPNTDVIDLGAARDRLFVSGLPSGGRVDGGAGSRDFLTVSSDRDFTLDAARRRLGLARMLGFDTYVLDAPTLTFLGGPRSEEVHAIGCRVRLRGAAGSDLLTYANDDWRSTLPECTEYRFRIKGGKGKDVLIGWSGRDTLIGGSGRDTATGKQGRDVCRAEVERQC